ncbi:MAG TPA: type II toxin-antitoxin system VapC family toxin [Terriglobales bacterium]|nr:type II toxin-antitoxin system VapC family toxin [Terriglobales bacterium]
MKILLDTHCWLWMAATPERFSPPTRALIESTSNELYFSAASAWELAIKYSLGKLHLPEAPETYVPKSLFALQIQTLSIEHTHALRVAALPEHHRDPFDRLLIAQAQLEDLKILTADPLFALYDVSIIAA